MDLFVTVLHVVTCFALVGVILLQHGKGADMGAAFGSGASNTVFGARGAGNFLTKLTTGAVVVFMGTSITLSYFTAPQSITNIIEDAPAVAPAPDEGEAGGGMEGLGSTVEEIPAPGSEIEEIPAPTAGDAGAEPPPSE